MANEIHQARPKEVCDPDLQMGKPTIMKTRVEQATQVAQCKEIDSQQGQAWDGHIQGSSYETYCINKMYKLLSSKKNFRLKCHPVPDPAKMLTKPKSTFDPTILCKACGQCGHPAARCFVLCISSSNIHSDVCGR